MINTQSFKLDIKQTTTPRLRVVNGDTANVFVITVQDGGDSVTLDTSLHKIIAVFTRADGEVYAQDADTGVSFTTGGVVTITVHPDSFRTGTNRVCLQIYKRENSSETTYPLLCTTNEAQFPARSQAIPDSGAPNAPSQLPMLEGLIEDAREAISDCEDATEAANDAADAADDAADAANTAAETLNGLLENIDDAPVAFSENLVKSGGVHAFATILVQDLEEDHLRPYTTPLMDGDADIGGMTHQFAYEDHVHPHDTSKQDVLTFDNAPTHGSNNPVKSGGVYAALAGKQNLLVWDTVPTAGSNKPVTSGGIYTALSGKQNTLTFDNAPTASSDNPVKSGGIKTAIDAAAKKNVYLVKHDAEISSGQTGAQGLTADYADDLMSVSDNAVFATQITIPSGNTVTLYEYIRDTHDCYYLKSEAANGTYVTATLELTDEHRKAQITFDLYNDESPLMLHVTGTEEVQGAGGQTYRIVHLDSDDVALLYAQRYTREFQMQLPAWGTQEGTTLDILLRKGYVKTTGTVCVIGFTSGMVAHYSDSVEEITPSGFDEWIVNVYYVDGVLHSCTASHIKKVF